MRELYTFDPSQRGNGADSDLQLRNANATFRRFSVDLQQTPTPLDEQMLLLASEPETLVAETKTVAIGRASLRVPNVIGAS